MSADGDIVREAVTRCDHSAHRRAALAALARLEAAAEGKYTQADLDFFSANADEYFAMKVAADEKLRALEIERNEAQAEATTARIGQHVCETGDGTWRPCPASLCEGARLLTEHDHHYVKQVQRAMHAKAQRDTLTEALRAMLVVAEAGLDPLIEANAFAVTRARAALAEIGES